MEMSKKNSRTVTELSEFSRGSVQVQRESKSKQTLTLASDGMVLSLFPTMLQYSLIHNCSN